MNSKLVTISVLTRNADNDEYDLFPEMKNGGIGTITAIDSEGNPVDMPQDLKNALLSWAGYDVAN